MAREMCVYCKRWLVMRALERVPEEENGFGWQCRSVRACARRQSSTR